MKPRLTKHRTAILEFLESHHEIFSAAQLHQELSFIDLATIYRSLEYLVEQGLVRKLDLGMAEARYEQAREHHHHAVCNTCKQVIHFTAPDEKLKKLLGLEHFEIEELEITVRGRCK